MSTEENELERAMKPFNECFVSREVSWLLEYLKVISVTPSISHLFI